MRHDKREEILICRLVGALVMALMMLLKPQLAKAGVWDNAPQVEVCPLIYYPRGSNYLMPYLIDGKMLAYKSLYSVCKSEYIWNEELQSEIMTRGKEERGVTILIKEDDSKGYMMINPFFSHYCFIPGVFTENCTVFSIPSGLEYSYYGGSGDNWTDIKEVVYPMIVDGDSIKCLDDISEISFKVGEESLELIKPSGLNENGQFTLGYRFTDYINTPENFDEDDGYPSNFIVAADMLFESEPYYPFGIDMKYKMMHFDRYTGSSVFTRDLRSVKVGVRGNTYYMLLPIFAQDLSKGSYVLIGDIEDDTVRFRNSQYVSLGTALTSPVNDYYDQSYALQLSVVNYELTENIYGYRVIKFTFADNDLIFKYDPKTLNLTDANVQFGISWDMTESGSCEGSNSNGFYIHPQVLDYGAPIGGIQEMESENTIILEGQMVKTNRPTTINVYSIEGKIMASTIGTELNLSSIGHGVFIIKTNSETRKIVL